MGRFLGCYGIFKFPIAWGVSGNGKIALYHPAPPRATNLNIRKTPFSITRKHYAGPHIRPFWITSFNKYIDSISG